MASIINALRNIKTDTFWGAKLLVLSLAPFAVFSNSQTLKTGNQYNYFLCQALCILLLLGVSSFMMNRNINNRTPLLPNIPDIIVVVKDAVCMFIVMAPFSAVMYYALDFYINNFKFEEEIVNWFFYFAITFTCSPFIFIPAVLYSVRGNLFDAFRVNIILNEAGNFIVQAMSFCLQYIFTILIAAFLSYEIFHNMLNDDAVFVSAVYSFFVVLSVLTIFSYCSDLYIDVIPEIKDIKEKKVKKRK